MARSFSPSPNPQSWRTVPCWLSSTAYLFYSQLHPISGGRLLNPQSEDTKQSVEKVKTKRIEEEV